MVDDEVLASEVLVNNAIFGNILVNDILVSDILAGEILACIFLVNSPLVGGFLVGKVQSKRSTLIDGSSLSSRCNPFGYVYNENLLMTRLPSF